MRKIDKSNNIHKANLLCEFRHALVNENIVNGKYPNKKSILNVLYKILKAEHVEGRYTDEHWLGISKLKSALAKYEVDYDLVKSEYQHNSDYKTKLPNSKVYIFNIKVIDKMGKENILPLQVTCAFVGRTGTMEDDTYELTYYFMA